MTVLERYCNPLGVLSRLQNPLIRQSVRELTEAQYKIFETLLIAQKLLARSYAQVKGVACSMALFSVGV